LQASLLIKAYERRLEIATVTVLINPIPLHPGPTTQRTVGRAHEGGGYGLRARHPRSKTSNAYPTAHASSAEWCHSGVACRACAWHSCLVIRVDFAPSRQDWTENTSVAARDL